ncbi:MAG: hypothetical protein WA961_14540 [Rhodanobacter sp.]
MNELRFKVGDLAIFAIARDISSQNRTGQQCEVYDIGPFQAGERLAHPTMQGYTNVLADADYVVVFADGLAGAPKDYQLRKIDPPIEPIILTRAAKSDAGVSA